MTTFLLNILLAFAWVAVIGRFEPPDFAIGFFCGYLILRLIQPAGKPTKYFLKLRQVVLFIFFFIFELIKANLRVAYDVVTIRHYMRPGVIEIPLDVQTEAEITLLANLITLTPGTLSLDVSANSKFLYVHAMYIDNREDFIRSIKDGFERRIRELLE
jgi:multicomponent Na+:H+ antiporter subunit E